MRREHPWYLVPIWNEGLDTWDNPPSSNTESGRQVLCMRQIALTGRGQWRQVATSD